MHMMDLTKRQQSELMGQKMKTSTLTTQYYFPL